MLVQLVRFLVGYVSSQTGCDENRKKRWK